MRLAAPDWHLGAASGLEAAAHTVTELPAHIADRITVHPLSGCWVVDGALDRGGYARIGGRGAHRVIWEILEGRVPDGLVLDHREDWGCLFKSCGWPAHLLPVTPRVNSTRPGAGGVGAWNAAKDRCDHGHLFDGANTYWRPDGHRDCRACGRRRVAEYAARQQEKLTAVADLARAA